MAHADELMLEERLRDRERARFKRKPMALMMLMLPWSNTALEPVSRRRAWLTDYGDWYFRERRTRSQPKQLRNSIG